MNRVRITFQDKFYCIFNTNRPLTNYTHEFSKVVTKNLLVCALFFWWLLLLVFCHSARRRAGKTSMFVHESVKIDINRIEINSRFRCMCGIQCTNGNRTGEKNWERKKERGEWNSERRGEKEE